jgi:NADH-quinone oxidoreductase subunit B
MNPNFWDVSWEPHAISHRYPAHMRISVTHLALACCAMEVSTAVALDLPAVVDGLEIFAADGSVADLNVLVVAGTVTAGSVARLDAAWAALAEPRAAIAYGVCASSGGPYWDSYAVVESSAVAFSRFVPGCPPPRSTLLDAVVATANSGVDA